MVSIGTQKSGCLFRVFGRVGEQDGNNISCCQGACKISTWLRDSVTAARTHIVLCCSTPGDLHQTEEWVGKQLVCHPSLVGSERESVSPVIASGFGV